MKKKTKTTTRKVRIDMTAKPDKERQAAFKDRMRKAGLAQVTVWVPVPDVPKHSKYVERLRNKALALNRGKE